MGCGLSRQLVIFTNLRVSHCRNHEGRYYLSELLCEFVWGAEGHDIYRWAKDKELLETSEDYRSVDDMIQLCKKLKKNRGEYEFTREERERYIMFLTARNLKRIGNHKVYTTINHYTDTLYEYVVTQ